MRKFTTCWTTPFLLAWAMSPGLAQAADGAPDSQDGDTPVGEILVTAQKRSESILKVPSSISALSNKALEERGITSAQDLQFAVPSVQVGRFAGATQVFIRGIGAAIPTGAVESGVATHVDGVYQPRLDTGDLAQIDLQRVEVLRGPQGTLYGRNATGGAVNFITNKPGDRFEGRITLSGASYDQVGTQAILSGPLTSDVRVRAVFNYLNRDTGFEKNLALYGSNPDAEQQISGRIRIAADLADNLDLDLVGYAFRGNGPGQYQQPFGPQSPGALALNPALATASWTSQPRKIFSDLPSTLDRRAHGATATLTWEPGSIQVKSISGYQFSKYRDIHDADGTDLAFINLERDKRSKTFTEELNISGRSSIINWIFGAYFLWDRLNNHQNSVFPSGISLGGLNVSPDGYAESTWRDETSSLAAFADFTVKLTDHFSVIGGLRHSEDKKHFVQTNIVHGPVTLVPPATPAPVEIPSIVSCENTVSRPKFSATTPRLGVQFDVASGHMAYAMFSRGYKSGNINYASCGQIFKPEKVSSYEAGYKVRLLNGSLALNLSGFYYNYSDYQIFQVVGLGSQLVNAPAVKIKGVEVEALYRLGQHLTLDGASTLTHARFSSFSSLDLLTPEKGVINLEGKRLPFTPDWSATVGAEYDSKPIDGFGTLKLRTEIYLSGQVYFREFNAKADRQKPYQVVNTYLTWSSINQHLTARLWAKNLFGQEYISSLLSNDVMGIRNVNWAPPRQVGIDATLSF